MQESEYSYSMTSTEPYERLQALARMASAYFLLAAGILFFGGSALIIIVLYQLGDMFGGAARPSLAQYAQYLLMYATSLLLPVAVLAAAGVGLRLYAEAQSVREDRHLELLATMNGGLESEDGDAEGVDEQG